MIKTSPSTAGGTDLTLVKELRFLMPCGQKHKTRSNTVTNSIKTIKNGHQKKIK